MIHPGGSKLLFDYVPSNETVTAPIKEVQVERNAFGYLVNVVLATVWLLLFVYLSVSFVFDDGQPYKIHFSSFKDYYRLIDPIPRGILALAGLILGIYHAYILHFNDRVENDTLTKRIIKNWPLILGTILYVSAVCFVYILHGDTGDRATIVTNNTQFSTTATDFFFSMVRSAHKTRSSYQNFHFFLIFLNAPLIICLAFILNNYVSNIFNPWNVKTVENDTNELFVFEYRVFGFLVHIFLSMFWFGAAVFTAGCLDDPQLPKSNQLISVLTVTHICSIFPFGAHIYNLCTPKYDSGDGYFKKNWVLLSSCVVLMTTYIVWLIYGEVQSDTENLYSPRAVLTTLAIIFSILSCGVMIPSNKSKSCTGSLKPWNTLKKTEEVSV